jgi:hypothetical protein
MNENELIQKDYGKQTARGKKLRTIRDKIHEWSG